MGMATQTDFQSPNEIFPDQIKLDTRQRSKSDIVRRLILKIYLCSRVVVDARWQRKSLESASFAARRSSRNLRLRVN